MKRVKSFLALLLVCSMLWGNCSAMAVNGGDPAFVVAQVSANAGEDVDVAISLENNPGIASAKLTVVFDDGLTLTGVTYNEDMGGMSMPPSGLTSPVILNWLDFEGNFTGDAVFATLHFTVADTAESGAYSIEVTYEADNVYNIAEDNVYFHVSNGAVTVEGEDVIPDMPVDPVEDETPDPEGADETPADEAPDPEGMGGVPEAEAPDAEDMSAAPEEEAPTDSNVNADQSGVSSETQDVVEAPEQDASQTEDDGGAGIWVFIALLVCAVAVCVIVFARARGKRDHKDTHTTIHE